MGKIPQRAGKVPRQRRRPPGRCAGKTLKAKHDEGGGKWDDWVALLKSKIGISKSRASELMQIADGRKTVEEVREDRRRRDTAKRKISPPRGGETNSRGLAILEDESGDADGRKTVEGIREKKAEKHRQLRSKSSPLRNGETKNSRVIAPLRNGETKLTTEGHKCPLVRF